MDGLYVDEQIPCVTKVLFASTIIANESPINGPGETVITQSIFVDAFNSWYNVSGLLQFTYEFVSGNCAVGVFVGTLVGFTVGILVSTVGEPVRVDGIVVIADGNCVLNVGNIVGLIDGLTVGIIVGLMDGFTVGITDGIEVNCVGMVVGVVDGVTDGDLVGIVVGVVVGFIVGVPDGA